MNADTEWRKAKYRLRTPDFVRKAGPMKDRKKYSRKAKHKGKQHVE